MHRRGAGDRVLLRARGGLGQRLARVAVGLADRLEQALEREPDVGDDRVAHRRARRLVGVVGDRDQRGALGQQRARDVRVVREDRGADDEDQVVAGERLGDRADRRRQHAAEVRVALGEADPPAARSPGSPTPAGAGARPARPPRPRRRSASMSGPATSTGLSAALEPPGEVGDRLRVAGARGPLVRRAIAARASASSTSASQSSIGIETNAGPLGGSVARCAARPSASGTSSARGGS